MFCSAPNAKSEASTVSLIANSGRDQKSPFLAAFEFLARRGSVPSFLTVRIL